MSVPTSEERLGVRMSGETKRLIERAATLDGTSVSDFVRRAAERSARSVLERQRERVPRITLEPEAFDAFIAACDAPAPTNAALRRALDGARDYGIE